MRFLVDHIDDRGRTVEAGLADPWARAAVADAMDAEPSSLSAALDVQNAKGLVHVTGRIAALASRICDRCAEPVRLTLESDVDLHYAPKAKETDAHPEQELQQDELDVGWYEGGEIDLADVVREAVALSMPVRVVCEDVVACDERVSRLLAPAAPVGNPALASLKTLLRT